MWVEVLFWTSHVHTNGELLFIGKGKGCGFQTPPPALGEWRVEGDLGHGCLVGDRVRLGFATDTFLSQLSEGWDCKRDHHTRLKNSV